MYGEDSCGRRVNLLSTSVDNDTFTRPKLPNRSRPSTSSISSCASCSREGNNSSQSSSSGSPRHSHSPPTPPLVHLDSQSSQSQSSSSPMTPQYGFEPMDQHLKRDQNATPYYNQNQYRTHGYPPMQDATPQAYYNLSNQQALPPMNDFEIDPSFFDPHSRTLQPLQTQLQQAPPLHHNSPLTQLSPHTFQTPSSTTTATPSSLPPLSSASAAPPIKPDPSTPLTNSSTSHAPSSSSASGKPPLAKKKYPCPHASRYSCTDTFTTSGHAARHGKKHTGEKNILCPTCNKAFTRKDNMKQHERTHKGGSSSRAGSVAGSPVIGSKGEGRKDSMASSNADAMDVDDMGVVPKRPKMARSELSEIMEGISKGHAAIETAGEGDVDADGEGESPGLDALATAASELA